MAWRVRCAFALVAVVAACADEPAGPALLSATPGYGPLVGGTTIVLHGTGFARNAPVRVSIAGREAPLAHAIDPTSIEVVIPPGERAGDAEVTVLAGDRAAVAAHVFHYSAPASIEAVSPAEVDHDTSPTMTVTGHGFVAEAVGELAVLVDGVAATDVLAIDDTTLTFIAPPGTAFVKADVEVRDLRGRAEKRAAFRYRAGPRPGLVLFSRFGPAFATFFDPVDGTSFAIPRAATANASFTSVVRDETGEYWAFDRSLRWGRIDMRTQALISPVQTNLLFPTLVRVGSAYFGIERFTQKFGRFDPIAASFTPLSSVPCCGSYGLASDGTTIWLVARRAGTVAISTIDPSTGELGTAVPLSPVSPHVEELRWFAGVLYASTANQTLLAIDPVTGATVVQPVAPGRANAMEVGQ